jgi:hypothetical protein
LCTRFPEYQALIRAYDERYEESIAFDAIHYEASGQLEAAVRQMDVIK